MGIPIWSDDINILMNESYITDLWPLDTMCYERKINSIVRMIILLTCLGFVLTQSVKFLVIGVFTLLSIHFYVKSKNNTKSTSIDHNDHSSLEGFKSINPNNNNNIKSILKDEFSNGNKNNPFSNVLLTDINNDPHKKSAPPSFNPKIENDINANVKKTIQKLNPGIKNTDKQLFGDLYENFKLDQSNRNFYSTPNTKVVNDQAAFAQYCYGDMPSAKESSIDGNIQREKNSSRYNLY